MAKYDLTHTTTPLEDSALAYAAKVAATSDVPTWLNNRLTELLGATVDSYLTVVHGAVGKALAADNTKIATVATAAGVDLSKI